MAAAPLWMLYPVFFAAVYLSHLTLLRLPYFWDEGGYYIPAAWDFFRTGTLIPVTTVTNAHPPLPSILLAGWWHLSGFVPSGTRTFICMVAAAALLAVYRIARNLLGTPAAIAVTVLTGLYPVWFAQSTLAHADIFAAAFTLWAISCYFQSESVTTALPAPSSSHRDSQSTIHGRQRNLLLTAILFSLAALSKETAIITPAALSLWETACLIRDRTSSGGSREPVTHSLIQIAALLFPILPLAAWYAYHYHRTGFVFGNPEFLRYNATANLDAHRIALCLYHRFLHLTLHMNMFVPVICTLAVLLFPALAGRTRLSRSILSVLAVILIANWIAFSVLGGALLTRYLLPMYPLILLLCVDQWQLRLTRRAAFAGLAALAGAAFLCGIWINPPYAFAPEDNLTYRDFIVLHQRAINLIAAHYANATVLTAWPAVAELERPELGYTKVPVKAVAIQNFSLQQLQKAASEPGDYDLALIFSTKWAPPPGRANIARGNQPADARYFDFHEDLRPAQAAAVLHGRIVWQASKRGEWIAILTFPRIESASLTTPVQLFAPGCEAAPQRQLPCSRRSKAAAGLQSKDSDRPGNVHAARPDSGMARPLAR
jgi:4-amino-4-deoxy-L-arabinose transferase-like glycosyltransferase